MAHVALPHVTGEPGEADAVAARDGKTRGAITNLFGSQAAYQTETMTRTEPHDPVTDAERQRPYGLWSEEVARPSME